jgi:hypothetical protein
MPALRVVKIIDVVADDRGGDNVEQGDERVPRSVSELSRLVRRHLEHVHQLIANDDFSYRALFQANTKERELQSWVASCLRERARGLLQTGERPRFEERRSWLGMPTPHWTARRRLTRFRCDDFQAGVIPTLVTLMRHRLIDAQRRLPCATLALRPLPIASRARNGQAPRIISRLTAGVAIESFFQRRLRAALSAAIRWATREGARRHEPFATICGGVAHGPCQASLLLLFTLHVLIVSESLKACPRC